MRRLVTAFISPRPIPARLGLRSAVVPRDLRRPGAHAGHAVASADLRGHTPVSYPLTFSHPSGTGVTFRVSAVDDRGVPVSILDPTTGVPSSGVDFAIGP
jgi:hypothetical protein